MSSTQTHAGTFISRAKPDATFGARFGYYIEQIKRKLESEWYAALLDPQAQGHRVYITFRSGATARPPISGSPNPAATPPSIKLL